MQVKGKIHTIASLYNFPNLLITLARLMHVVNSPAVGGGFRHTEAPA